MLLKLYWFLKTIVYKLFFKRIGKLSYIGTPLLIKNAKKIELGNKVRILPGIRMEVYGENASIKLYNNISIGQNLHIISGGKLTIYSNCTISANVLITNIDHDYQEIDKHILEQKFIINETKIGENCFIGYGAVIQAGAMLGKQCIVGSNAVVRGVFPDYCVIVGIPAKIVKRYDEKTKIWKKTNSKGEFLNAI